MFDKVCRNKRFEDIRIMSRRANSVIFGFDFQENAAIVLMIENMAEMDSVKIEGEEDIELKLNDGSSILAQAKSVVRASSDFTNVRAKAKAAMQSLSDASEKVKVRKLIYYTNSPNPFNDEASKPMFYGKSQVKYDDLPDSTKELIGGWLSQIEKPLEVSNLQIHVLPFETDGDEQRYRVVLQSLSDFIGEMDLRSADGLRKRLHEIWLSMLDRNGSSLDAEKRLSKKDVVWPMIVFVTGRGRLDRNAQYCTDLDDGEFEAIEYKYGNLIEDYCERYDFVVKVLTDYREGNYKGRQAIEQFVNDHYEEYVDELGLDTLEENLRCNLSRIVLFTIVHKRHEIDKIKRSVNL